MLRTRVIPCLLIQGRSLVKTKKFRNPRYIGDPINAIKIFNEKEVDEIFVLDITATKEKRKPQFDLISELASESFMPFSYGGGISSLEEVQKLFNTGVEKIVLNTAAVYNPSIIENIANIYGTQSVVISIDVRKNMFGKYQVFTNAGTKRQNISPIEHARNVENIGAGEILLTSIENDGMQNGYDLSIIKSISDAVSIPVVACGGASSIDDFRCAVVEGGASGVAAGSLFVFHGKHQAVLITYPSYEMLKNNLP